MKDADEEMKCALDGSHENKQDDVLVSPRKCRRQDSKWAAFVCASATLCQSAIIGMILCYGVLFPSISETLGSSRALTAGVHSLRSAILFCTGPVSGALCTRFNCRKVNTTGIVFISLGYMLSSFATSIETLYITFGILVGIGASMTHISNLSAVNMYFNKYQNLATGFTLSGNSMGLFVLAPVTRELLKAFGLFNTLRGFAAISILPLCFTYWAYDPNVESSCTPQLQDKAAPKSKFLQVKKLVKFKSLRNRQFVFIIISMAFHYFAIATPAVHLARHCLDIGISGDLSAQAYTVFAAVGVIGRIVTGKLGDWKRVNNHHIIQLCMLVAGVTNCLMPDIKTFPVIIAYVIVIGLACGAVVSLLPGSISRAVGKREYAQAQGLFMFFMCPFIAAGPAISGLIADKIGGYSAAFYMIGSSQLMCALLSFVFMYFGSNDSDSKDTETDEPTTEESQTCVLQQRITVL